MCYVSDRNTKRLTVWIRGHVQGVGFRWWARSRALELGLLGSASNLSDGRVEIIAEGPKPQCQQFLSALRSSDPPGRVDSAVERWSAARGSFTDFSEC